MSIYDQNYQQIWSDLLPPSKRLPKWLQWGIAMFSPNQWLRDLIFSQYTDGSSATDWASGGTYAYGDRVRYLNNSVYELITVLGITGVTTPPDQDIANWIKVLDTWIGVRERARYTGQKLFMEYALNKYFKVPPVTLPFTGASHSTQIWISNANNSQSNFWLSNGDPLGLISYMSNTNSFQRFFLGNSYTYDPFFFTIHVPTAVYAAIQATIPSGSSSTSDDIIRGQADKLVQSGKYYKIVQY